MDIFKERHSIRKYKSDMVPKELIDQVIEAGLSAPSGMNKQDAIIIAITDKDTRDMLSKVNASILGTDKDPFYGAPVILLVAADKNWGTRVNDGSLALGYMMLKATELGLGSCWIHRAKEELGQTFGKNLLKKLGLPDEYEGIGHLALGYPDETPEPKPIKEGRIFYI